MCRLFGFRSVIPSQMHRSLIAADNALGRQSERHPDGWGVAYYVDGDSDKDDVNGDSDDDAGLAKKKLRFGKCRTYPPGQS